MSPALAGRFLTTVPPGKPHLRFLVREFYVAVLCPFSIVCFDFFLLICGGPHIFVCLPHTPFPPSLFYFFP